VIVGVWLFFFIVFAIASPFVLFGYIGLSVFAAFSYAAYYEVRRARVPLPLAAVVALGVLHTFLLLFVALSLRATFTIHENGMADPMTLIGWGYVMFILYFMVSIWGINLGLWLILLVCRQVQQARKADEPTSALSRSVDALEWTRTTSGRRARLAVSAVISLIVTLAGFGAGVWATPVVKYIELPVVGLHPDLVGFRFAMMTDLHAGNTVSRTQIQTAVDLSQSTNPDAILVVGDMVDGPVAKLEEHLSPLTNPSDVPFFVVTGNHDHFYDTAELLAYLDSFDHLTLVNNKLVTVSRGNATLDVAGVFDYSVRTSDEYGENFTAIDAARVDRDDVPLVFLAHQPNHANALIDHFDPDAVLCGHVHEGQAFPINVISFITNDYFSGLYTTHTKAHVYVSAGTNYWGTPVRVGTESEVTIIDLVAA
jgi:predicted MPP superfamily phosphohydrolase